MEHRFAPGDFLFFQLEAGFALIRILDIEIFENETIWHIAVYQDLFPDSDAVERAIETPGSLSIAIPHVALTNRAFESTQVAFIGRAELSKVDKQQLIERRSNPDMEISDRSVRLHLGFR